MTQVKTYLACCPIAIGKGIVGIGQPLPSTVSKAKIESLLANGSIKEAGGESSATLAGGLDKDGRVVELKNMTVEVLKKLATDLEIVGADQMKKDALVEAITAVEFAVKE